MNLNEMNAIRKLKNPKTPLLILLAALAIFGLVGGHDVSLKLAILGTSLTAAMLAEWALFGAVPLAVLQSAAISGGIVGLLVAPGADPRFAWTAAVLAIASKKLLVFHEGKHIFNPAAFGLVVSMMIFGNRINWWGNTSAVLVIVGGGLILMRLRRLSLPFAYFIARTAGIVLLTSINAGRAALLLPNLFFAFIMLVEPKTSPGKRPEQWIFGGICGILATTFYHFASVFEGDLLALLTVNLLRPWLTIRLSALQDNKRTRS